MSLSRLSTYRLIAAAPLAAMASGATADIVYTEMDFQLGGPGSEPYFGSIQIGNEIGTMSFLAGSNSKGPERLFFAGVKDGNMAVMNSIAAPFGDKSGNNLARFQAGDLIQLDLNLGLSGKGVGSHGKDIDGGKGNGNFVVMNGQAESGYVGFVFENMGVNGIPSLNYGWISVSWDGTYLNIDGYAYETDADTGIVAGAIPAPGAIGLLGLAAGAAGIRRKRQA